MKKELCLGRRARAIAGGRSNDYALRHDQRESGRTNAAYWAPAAARAALAVLDEMRRKRGEGRGALLWTMFNEPSVMAEFAKILRSRLSEANAQNALAVIGHHAALAGKVYDQRLIDRCLRPWRLNAVAPEAVEDGMEVPRPEGPDRTIADVLSESGDGRMRSMSRNRRIIEGIGSWDLEWLEEPGVACYERCKRRIDHDGEGALARSVRTRVMQTALHNAADHHIVLRMGESPRWASVSEEARAFEMPDDDPLRRVLCCTETVTPAQAVSLMGNGVHIGAGRALVRELIAEGSIKEKTGGEKTTYGGAFSGGDMLASAVYAETRGQMTHEFASESDRVPRKALLAAWGEAGLTEARCHHDALSEAAVSEARVDVWTSTPGCIKHSRRSNAPDAEAVLDVARIDRSLDYVRRRRPRVVIMENVNDQRLAERLGAILSRIRGYRWRRAVINPSQDLGSAMDRERAYWVGTLKSD